MADPSFELNSTQTAIAIIPPEHLIAGIQTIRSVHDKAHLKWPPHFNILYPSITAAQLPQAIQRIRQKLSQEPTQASSLQLAINKVESFRHRKNATVFLKLNEESEELVKQLRRFLCSALGRDEHEGTVEGEFKPHLTLGQAPLQGNAEAKLWEKARNCLDLQWNCVQLAVLRRNSAGNMDVVDVIRLGSNDDKVSRVLETSSKIAGSPGWDLCHHFDDNHDNAKVNTSASSDVFVASLNVMTEDFAPPFEQRLGLLETEIRAVLATTDAHVTKVLCLQEINQSMLSPLLNSKVIATLLPYRSHTSDSALPSIRNKLILASAPFKNFNLQFPERHKSALFANFGEFTVVNVHLTSALTNESVSIKKRQMDIITDFLIQTNLLKSAIIAGDFNLTTSTSTIQTAVDKKIITREIADVIPVVINTGRWKDAFLQLEETENDEDILPGEEGATFDRLHNPLAAASRAPIDNRPQRYDRILFYNGGIFEARTFGMFAKPESGESGHISDHYGIFALLQTPKQESKPKTSNEAKLETITLLKDEFDLTPLLQPYMPTDGDRKQRENALSSLESALKRVGAFIVAPIGSYALDTYFSDSDIDVLVIGGVDPSIFFDNACVVLSKSGDDGPHAILVNSLVRILEVVVNGIKIDTQYCYAPSLLSKHEEDPLLSVEQLVFDESIISSLLPKSLRPLNTLRDTIYLKNSIPQLSSFRVAHRFLSIFLRNQGVYSAKFGYLGGIHLTLMLNRLVKLMTAQSTSESFTPATIVKTFLGYYANFDWSNAAVEDPYFRPSIGSYALRASREALVIRSLHLPTARANVAESCTSMSARTIATTFRVPAGMFQFARRESDSVWNWCLRPVEASISDFLSLNLNLTLAKGSQPGCFIRVKIEMWDLDRQSSDNVKDFVGGVESRMPSLLVALGKHRGEEIIARAWPGRFWVPEGEKEVRTEESSLVGYYLIGVTKPAEKEDGNELHVEVPLPSDERGRQPVDPNTIWSNGLMGKIITAARDHERALCSASKAVQSTSGWISVDVVERKKLGDMGLSIDSRDWTSFAGSDARRQDVRSSSPAKDTKATKALSSRGRGKGKSASSQQQTTAKSSLRPIQDILSRLHWDDSYNAEEYVIGYEDRFDGVMEIPMTSWSSETTDEEFIPLHRIVWVRKRGEDGEKVWDRRVRYDAIFGSGSAAPMS
jgi:uncharacterized protein (UPF0248 family)/2'-5' RNA ligase